MHCQRHGIDSEVSVLRPCQAGQFVKSLDINAGQVPSGATWSTLVTVPSKTNVAARFAQRGYSGMRIRVDLLRACRLDAKKCQKSDKTVFHCGYPRCFAARVQTGATR